jgi:hypothetical protein
MFDMREVFEGSDWSCGVTDLEVSLRQSGVDSRLEQKQESAGNKRL